ncbi:MAG: hypothetical protein Q4A32_06775 [Lachnospiraceae bacterium]|nr:hypothetical protein [Lachnospiraceae bacterium]
MIETLFLITILYMVLITLPAGIPPSGEAWVISCYGLLILIVLITKHWERKKHRHLQAMRLALCLKAIGLIVSFSYKLSGIGLAEIQAVARSEFMTILLDAACFVVGIRFAANAALCHNPVFGWFSMLVMPLHLLLARFTSAPIHGSYLSAFGILSFSVCMAFAPFAAAYSFCDTRFKNPFSKRLTSISGNELGFLLLLVLLAGISGKVNHEYGLVLVFVGAVGGFVFILYGRSTFSKIALSLCAFLTANLVTLTSTKVQTRLSTMRSLADAWNNGNLSGEATQLYYFFLRVKGAGFYGYGSGQLSQSLYPTALNDYIFVTIFYNYGVITGFLAFALAIMMCWSILRNETRNRYDGIVNQSIAILFGAIYILSFYGNLGSIPLTGVSPLFMASAGHTMDAAAAWLLGISAGLGTGRTD